jgi:hypothetical protein
MGFWNITTMDIKPPPAPTGTSTPKPPAPSPTVAKPKLDLDADTYTPPTKAPTTKAPATTSPSPADYFGDLKSMDAKKFKGITPAADAEAIPAKTKEAEEAMEKKDYKTAAKKMNEVYGPDYGGIGVAKGDAAEATATAYATDGTGKARRLETLKNQANVLATMEDAIGHKPEYPPSEKDLKEYFKSLKGKDSQTVADAWKDYADAFQVHAGKRGDVTYSDKHEPSESLPPKRPIESLSSKRPWDAGKTINDCEGYSALAAMCFKEAGYTPKFVAGMNTTSGGAESSHMLVALNKPGQDTVVVSSEKVVVNKSEKAAIDAGFKAVGYGKPGDKLVTVSAGTQEAATKKFNDLP